MKKFNVFVKIRSALRDIYRFSPQRRAAIDAVKQKDPEKGWFFTCTICKETYHIKLVQVDHQPPCGTLLDWEDLPIFAKQLFQGPVRILCIYCHAIVTKQQRRVRK
jgi:hypothetical protein